MHLADGTTNLICDARPSQTSPGSGVPDGGIRILQNRKNIKQIFKGLCVATKFKFRKTPKWGFVFVFEIKSLSLQ